MNLRITMIVALFLIAVSRLASAQESPQFPGPQPEHEWLQQFVGDWVTHAKATMEPGQPPIECNGTMSSHMLGGFWVINRTEGELLGTSMVGMQTIGFDTTKKKYIGTWVDGMTSYMWQYEGMVDETGKTLTLEAEGPNFMGDGNLTKFRDIYEFKSADEITITSQMLDSDGTWISFTSGTAQRKK